MFTVGINGAVGQMGKTLVRLVSESKDLSLKLALEHASHPQIGQDAGTVAGLAKPLGIPISALEPFGAERLTGSYPDESRQRRTTSGEVTKVDVIIDFSLPVGTMACLKGASKHKIPLVIGTTGLDKDHLKQIEEYSKNAACLVSPNMSIGANLLFKLAGQTAKSLGPDYDIEIVETHHRFKKDVPSGTAKRLAESVTKVTGKPVPTHSLRIGDVVGDHMVTYSNLGERIELVHRVHTREVFARGALVAARFIAKAKPGLYKMTDII